MDLRFDGPKGPGKDTADIMHKRRSREDTGSTGLYEALAEYSRSGYYPYHMPGHKRNKEAGEMAQYYGIDITEIDGFDNLHHAEGILLEAQRRANRMYGNEGTETFYLVNGSTCGVLASVMAATERGARILIARNCHKSVYHAAILQELRLRYYYPSVIETCGICDGVSAKEIGRLLDEYPDCGAVVITSPTYEGILSDVHAIADVVHAHGGILIVDEAHGAHLGLNEAVPPGAISGGADLVIHSLHKTLPAMTQTALLHVQGERVDRGKLRRYLSMLQTSSPSYVLMASIDSCVRYMEIHGAKRYEYMRRQYEIFCKKIEKCRYIRIGSISSYGTNAPDVPQKPQESCPARKRYHMAGWDIGKLVIYVRDGILSGRHLYGLLRDDYHLQMEMAAEKYVLAIMTIMDTQEGWQRLADALGQIDDRIEAGEIKPQACNANEEAGLMEMPPYGRGPASCGCKTADYEKGMIARAYLGSRREVPLEESVGEVAADFINLYPPGIPLVAPGEIVDKEMAAWIQKSMHMGLEVQGVTVEGKVAVVS